MDKVYNSFGEYEQVIYMGPSENELSDENEHVVVIVGNARIQIDDEVTNFFVLQNSYGESFGCAGYALIPTHLADEFWVPLVSNQQLSLRKLKKFCKEYSRQSHVCAKEETGEGSQNSGSRVG
ncbi:uncharacterized protein [Primulina eburnea]|uniref:uncharacterized protein n=1 Tax=Primulina eburnea TaxID=1245227 RepID=UPI003C6CBF4C